MEIELKHLAYFVAAAEHRSFRQAANALDVGQSVLSRRIRALEDGLGVSLFERGTLGARLTLAGERLQARTRFVLEELDELVRSAREAGRGMTGHVRIGLVCSLGPGFLRDLVRSYSERRPDVEIGVSEDGPLALRQFSADDATQHLRSFASVRSVDLPLAMRRSQKIKFSHRPRLVEIYIGMVLYF